MMKKLLAITVVFIMAFAVLFVLVGCDKNEIATHDQTAYLANTVARSSSAPALKWMQE